MSDGDPGSFRDPASRVLIDDESVVRVLTDRGLADWRTVSESTFLRQALDDGRVIAAEEVAPPPGFAGALRHPKVAPVTYPFEWTFSMLKDAALLQLDLLAGALDDGVMLKDATPYNIQFPAGRPLFIDVGSFEPYVAGEPWVAYRQFCRQFLFPLMLRAWTGVAFQPWLRGNPEGITAAEMKRLLPNRRRMSRAAFMHVELQARAEARLQGEAVRSSLADAGFTAEMIQTNVRGLRSLVEGIVWDGVEGSWADYHTCDHVGRDRSAKSSFLTAALDRHDPSVVLDLGANDGHFSLLAAHRGASVAAVDGDEAVLDRLYRTMSPGTTVSIVLTDLANPSPSQGWAGIERPGLGDRVDPDLVVAYGLIHHLLYTASVPVRLIVEWLASFRAPVVVEFVAPEDPMVERLSANKKPDEIHPDRDRSAFERIVADHFRVEAVHDLDGGTRVLYHLIPQ